MRSRVSSEATNANPKARENCDKYDEKESLEESRYAPFCVRPRFRAGRFACGSECATVGDADSPAVGAPLRFSEAWAGIGVIDAAAGVVAAGVEAEALGVEPGACGVATALACFGVPWTEPSCGCWGCADGGRCEGPGYNEDEAMVPWSNVLPLPGGP